MPRYDLIILGGGISGSTAAYIAGKIGLKTILIEKNLEPDGATARSGGVITRLQDNLEDALYAFKSINIIKEIVGDEEGIIKKGFLSIEDLEEAENDYKILRRFIPDMRLLEPSEVMDRWRYIKVYEGEIGVYAENDITIDPYRFIQKAWNRIREGGSELLLGRYVKKIIFRDKKVDGVLLDKDEVIYGDNIIVSMGAWTKDFMKIHGVKIKTLLLSIPIYKIKVDENNLIGLWDDEMRSYWRPYKSNMLIGGGYDGYRIKYPEEGFGKPREYSINLVRSIIEYRYRFSGWGIIESWSGPVSFSYKYKPIAQKIKKYDGLYVIDGLGGEGLARGPALAENIIKLVRRGL